jgi:ABC-type branched-subunit amino acid transport system substrate-binding protein
LCGLLVTLLLAGCRLPGEVAPTVKIGLVAPFEGRYRYVGYDVIYAVRLALREANAAGGVGGYSVELIAYDDGADPAMASRQARKLAADPLVVAAIGHFREDTTASALSEYAEAGIPLLAPAVLAPDLTQGEGPVFRLGPPVGAVASAVRHQLATQGVSQVALVSEGGPLGSALLADNWPSQMQLGPIVSLAEADWLKQIQASDADAVFFDVDPIRAGEAIKALREAGWRGGLLGGPELGTTDFAAVAGEAAAEATYVTPWPSPTDVTRAAAFVAAYREVSNGLTPGPLALPAYEAARALIEAVRQDFASHQAPSRRGVADALSAVETQGLLGVITFDAEGNSKAAPLHWYQVGESDDR